MQRLASDRSAAVRRSRLASGLAAVVAAAGVTAPIFYYLLGASATAQLGDEQSIASFLGQYRGVVTVVMLGAMLAGPRILGRAGVAPALLIAPVGALAAAIAVVVDGSLYALGLDDFGIPFSPGLTVEVGRRIRPSVFTGVLYRITEPGALPAAEPTWWPITSEGSRELGTARAEAVRYYRPLAHGPVTAEPS